MDEVVRNSKEAPLVEAVRKRLLFVKNCADHLRAHLLATNALQPVTQQFYQKAEIATDKAIEYDEVQQSEEARKAFIVAAQLFKRALDSETDELAKKVIIKRIHLCNSRAEYLEGPGRANTPIPRDIPALAQEGAIQAAKKKPEENGEWLVKVTIEGTRTMKDPLDPTLFYTVSDSIPPLSLPAVSVSLAWKVYMMSVSSKVLEDGVVIDTPQWDVIRRFYQFKMFHAKVSGATEYLKGIPAHCG